MPKSPSHRPLAHCRPRGVSMIEVMVALLVLSAGLAVIGAMQTRAVFNSSDAVLQGYAAQILLSFSEAKETLPSYQSASVATSCARGSLDVITADQTYFEGLLTSQCTTRRIVNAFPNLAGTLPCNTPFKSSINVYCQSSRTTIDLRQPIWAR